MTSTAGRRRSSPPWSAPATTLPMRSPGCRVRSLPRSPRSPRPNDSWWPPISTAAWPRSWTIRRPPSRSRSPWRRCRSLTVTPGTVGGRGVRPGVVRPAESAGSDRADPPGRQPRRRDLQRGPGRRRGVVRRRTPGGSGGLRLELQQITAEYRGVRLELKPTGIAVHLRGMNPPTLQSVTTQDRGEPGDLGRECTCCAARWCWS